MTIKTAIPETYLNNLKNLNDEIKTYQIIINSLCKQKEEFYINLLKQTNKIYKKTILDFTQEKINFEFDYIKSLFPKTQFWKIDFNLKMVEIILPDE